MNIEIISCDGGDWTVLNVDGENFYSGHDIPTHIWITLLRMAQNSLINDVVDKCVSDEEMEGLC